MFTTSLISVAIMLLYAVPGYLLVKTRLIKEHSISAFAFVLMYVCQPCLTVYTFQQAGYSDRLMANIGIIFGLSVAVMTVFLVAFFFIYKKKNGDVRYRISNIAVAFGNATFMGVPLLQALLPDNPEAVIYSSVFFIAMSILGWTVASALITQDLKYLKPMKVVFNPSVLALIVALPLFCCNVTLPAQLGEAVSIVGRMSTPLCMLIIGMRLATSRLREVFTDGLQYFTIAVKQIVMPLAALLLVWWLPVDYTVKLSFYVMCCCPVASVVLSFSEMLGGGQKSAANNVLLGTLFSVVTLPVMLLVIQAVA